MNYPSVKEIVSDGNRAYITRYFDGQLWYQTFDRIGARIGPEFPVPISDIGTATFLADEKAMLLMRYIRKHLAVLEAAKAES